MTYGVTNAILEDMRKDMNEWALPSRIREAATVEKIELLGEGSHLIDVELDLHEATSEALAPEVSFVVPFGPRETRAGLRDRIASKIVRSVTNEWRNGKMIDDSLRGEPGDRVTVHRFGGRSE